MTQETISYPGRTLPLLGEADLVVIGGGSAGCAAAVAAAQQGCSVILVESSNCAGGTMTNGLLPSIICMSDGRNVLSGGLCRTLVDRTAQVMKVKADYGWFNIHPEAVKLVLDGMLTENKVRVLFHTHCCDVLLKNGDLAAAVVSTPAGLAAVKGKIFADATGDGNLSALAGIPFELGDNRHEVMSPTLCALWSGVDYEAIEPRLRNGGAGNAEWRQAEKEGTIPVEEHHFVGFFRCGGSLGCANLGHAYGCRPLEADSYTASCIEGRKLARTYLDFYRERVAGFSQAELALTAPMLGVRESRRVRGEYQLNGDDYRARRHFADDIGAFAYPIDIHASRDNAAEQEAVVKRINATQYTPGQNYGIPYRALLASGIGNLLLAGRDISCDREIQSSIRVVPGCMITGEAAGVAAAQAVKTGCTLREVEIGVLQRDLKARGLHIAPAG